MKELRVSVKIPFVPNELFVVISARKIKREKKLVAHLKYIQKYSLFVVLDCMYKGSISVVFVSPVIKIG